MALGSVEALERAAHRHARHGRSGIRRSLTFGLPHVVHSLQPIQCTDKLFVGGEPVIRGLGHDLRKQAVQFPGGSWNLWYGIVDLSERGLDAVVSVVGRVAREQLV